jgi:flavodoxin/NAD-dependent dihydropyrimidine dehydrogenase PreA subunit
MRILIIYFSGTGNTHYIAERIKKSLSGETVKSYPIEHFNGKETNNFDILIFGFPVYGCKMPEFLKQFTEKFALTKSKKVILFSTYGYTPCNAMKYAANYFSEKGFNVIYSKGIKMPGSDGLLLIKKDSKRAKQLISKDFEKDKKIDQFLQEIKSAIYKKDSEPVIQQNLLFNLVMPLMAIVEPLIMKFATKLYANENCTHCGICEAVCPVNNIIVTKEQVLFGKECVLCLRCITQCPAEAIQIGNFTKGTVRWKGPNGTFNPLKDNLQSHDNLHLK